MFFVTRLRPAAGYFRVSDICSGDGLKEKPPQKEIPSAAYRERSSGDGTGGKVGGNRNLT